MILSWQFVSIYSRVLFVYLIPQFPPGHKILFPHLFELLFSYSIGYTNVLSIFKNFNDIDRHITSQMFNIVKFYSRLKLTIETIEIIRQLNLNMETAISDVISS